MGVSIVSTINIDTISSDMNGFYQCIAVYQNSFDQQTFHVHINTNSKVYLKIKSNQLLSFYLCNR